MDKPIRLSASAKFELVQAASWYRNTLPGLEARFKKSVLSALDSISRFPKAQPVARKTIRKKNLKVFPYTLYYREFEKSVRILSVMHFKQDRERFLKNFGPFIVNTPEPKLA